MLPVSRVAGKEITTLEGLPARWASQRGLPASEAAQTLHPVQQAWIDEQVPQCGFCQNGMMIKATELLEADAHAERRPDQGRVHERAVSASVPLRQLLRHPRRRAARGHRSWRKRGKPMATSTTTAINVHGATLTRRQFVKTGGALIVGFGLVGGSVWDETVEAARRPARIRSTPTLASSWFEIHADNTILIRTGKVDFGQTTAHTAYKQIVAEELNVPFEAITDGRDGRHRSHPGRRVLRGVPGVRRRSTCARPPPTRIRRCSTSRPATLAGGQEPAVGEGRRRLGRRQDASRTASWCAGSS